jgi:outer membrane receptor for Fe3+-dicitrate
MFAVAAGCQVVVGGLQHAAEFIKLSSKVAHELVAGTRSLVESGQLLSIEEIIADGTREESADGGIVEVPAFIIADLFGGYGRTIRRGLAMAGNLAVKNVSNTSWYTRTSDRNAGCLPPLPRSLYASMMVHFGRPNSRRRSL